MLEMKFLQFALVAITVTIFIAACGQPGDPPMKAAATPTGLTEPPAEGKPEVASEKELYAANCMICHRDTGKGGKITMAGKTIRPDDLTSAKMKQHTDDKLFSHISDGIEDEGMPAFKEKLTPDEIKAIVKYLRTLQAG
jgi:mono/diheme cytochrome c family protein